MSDVVIFRDKKLIRTLDKAADLLIPLTKFAAATDSSSATAMAAAACWLGFELGKHPDHARLRAALIEIMDYEIARKNGPKKT